MNALSSRTAVDGRATTYSAALGVHDRFLCLHPSHDQLEEIHTSAPSACSSPCVPFSRSTTVICRSRASDALSSPLVLAAPATSSSTPQPRPHSAMSLPTPPSQKSGKGSAFWLSFIAVVVANFLSALDMTAVSTAAPTMTSDLQGGDSFVWIGSAYGLASTAILPFSGRLADVFGRRPIMLASIVIFLVGSALAGAAQNMNWLIAARSTCST